MFFNKIVVQILTVFLMVTFLVLSALFLSDSSIFGQRNSYNLDNIILMVILSLLLVVLFIILSSIWGKSQRVEDAGSIFSHKYWKASANELLDMRKLIFASLMLAFMLAARPLEIPFGPTGIRWSFVPLSMAAVVLGPVGTIIISVTYSVLSWAMFGSGTFLFTVPLVRVIRGLVYGTFLYKTKITLTKIITLFFIISIIIDPIISGLNVAIFHMGLRDFEAIRVFLLTTRFPRDLIMFVPRIVLVYLTLKHLLPVFKGANLIDENVSEDISIF